MNKRILISLSVIGAVAAIAVGGTIAYFSDTETSTGNTFTAGELDLIIDIDGVQYNPLDRAIFTATDMKPGDNGEETLSLHVDNDACGFVSFALDSDLDNGCTEPEKIDEPTCTSNDVGELNDQVNWVIWEDDGSTDGWDCPDWVPTCTADPQEGDNVYQPEYEEVLTYGPLDENKDWAFGGLKASDVHYYGFAWCFGTIDPQTLVCDGSSVKNEAQTDSFSATMTITAEQYRNQYGTATDFPQGCPIY